MSNTSVRVFVRFRPFNAREKKEGSKSSINFDGESVVKCDDERQSQFSFDHIFQPTCTQEEVYTHVGKEVVASVLDGINGTIFAYGQTGAGKSFSMFGKPSNPELMGIIPRAATAIFDRIQADVAGTEFSVKCSFLEIYREQVKDLLNPKGSALKVREAPRVGVWVEGLSSEFLSSPEDVLEVLTVGEKYRTVASTSMNASSSRSHSIFMMTVEQKRADGGILSGKLNLADLAGSERVGKTEATGHTLKEAQTINQSLSALGNCINALTSQSGGQSSNANTKFVPFRDSKLTHLLKDSLGGNTKTTLLANCSPASFNLDETVSTLRFAQRASTIKTVVKANIHRSAAELESMIENLTRELRQLTKKSEKMQSQLAWYKSTAPNLKCPSDLEIGKMDDEDDDVTGDSEGSSVPELKAEIHQLKENAAETEASLREEILALKKELQSSNEDLIQTKNELKDAQDGMVQVNGELENAVRDKEAQSRRLAQAEDTSRSLQVQVDKLSATSSSLEEQRTSLFHKLTGLEADLSAADTKSSDMGIQIGELVQDLEEAEFNASKYKQQAEQSHLSHEQAQAKWSHEESDMKLQIDDLLAKRDKLEAELLERTAQCKDLESRNISLTSDIAAAKDAESAALSQLEYEKQSRAAVETNLREVTLQQGSDSEAMNARLSAFVQSADAAEARCKELEKQISELNVEKRTKADQRQSELRLLNQDFDTQMSTLQKQLADSQSQVRSLQFAESQQSAHVSNLERQVQAISRELDDEKALRTRIEATNQTSSHSHLTKIDALNSQLASLKEEKLALEGQGSSAISELAASKAEGESLRLQNNNLKTELAAAKEQCTSSQQAVQTLTEALHSIKQAQESDAIAKDTELNALREHVDRLEDLRRKRLRTARPVATNKGLFNRHKKRITAVDMAVDVVSKSGYMHKTPKGKLDSGWKKRWFVLKEGETAMLSYYKKESEASGSASGFIMLEEAALSRQPKHTLHIITSADFDQDHESRTYAIRCDGEREFEEWFQAIDSAITRLMADKAGRALS